VTAALDLTTARARAEALMSSTCTVFTPGAPITDPNTGEVTSTQTTVWFGPCRARPAGRQSYPAQVGGAEEFAFDYLISLPFSVSSVVEKMRLTVTGSPDAALVGITVEIQKVDRGDHVTARRLACTEVSG
jgi:hypothetical protein